MQHRYNIDMQFTFGLFEMLFRKKPSKYIALFKMNEKKKERNRKKELIA